MEVQGAGRGGSVGNVRPQGREPRGCVNLRTFIQDPVAGETGNLLAVARAALNTREFTLDKGLVDTRMWEIIYLQPRAPETPVNCTKASCAWRMWETVCQAPAASRQESRERAVVEGRPPAAGLTCRRPHAFLRIWGCFHLFTFPSR